MTSYDKGEAISRKDGKKGMKASDRRREEEKKSKDREEDEEGDEEEDEGDEEEDKIEKKDDQFFMTTEDLFDIPESGALTIRKIWEMKGLLTEKNKEVIFEYFKIMVDYAKMYEEMVEEEKGSRKGSSSKG